MQVDVASDSKGFRQDLAERPTVLVDDPVPVGVNEPHFKVFPEFRGASYAKRYELLLRRLVLEKLFDGAAF